MIEMIERTAWKILFIMNPTSGTYAEQLTSVINDYFQSSAHHINIHFLTQQCDVASLKEKIHLLAPHRVIAVGGDGTVSLVAECLLNQDIQMGILPVGTANGLAKELGISKDPLLALDILTNGSPMNIHFVRINNKLCVHLSDIGINAYAMKKFMKLRRFGMWGYLHATLQALWYSPRMKVEMQIDSNATTLMASSIIIANATSYGTGAIINPIGQLDDALFEVVVIKKISVVEIFKMFSKHLHFDSNKTEVFQTTTLKLSSKQKVYFQVDGEFVGKVNTVDAILLPRALEILVPFV